jgi:hypothetical protein
MTDLTAIPWRTWGSGVICAATSPDETGDTIIGRSGEAVAAQACADHNAVLDLEWLARAGFDIELSCRPGNPYRAGNPWRVSLAPAPDGWTAVCGQGGSIGEALAAARKWAEGRV